MKFWILRGRYESEIFSSIHLTEKGCALAAIADLMDFFHIDSDEEAVRVISESHEYRHTEGEKIEPFPWNHELLKDMSSEELWKVFGDWTETCWEQMANRSYYLDPTPQVVQA